jgi:deoxyhypusine monooxygenase
MSTFNIPPIETLIKCISTPNQPIGARMRAAYHLKQIYQLPDTSDQTKLLIVDTLGTQVDRKEHGELMSHEIAYVMGQIRDKRGLKYLMDTLRNRDNTTIVRHEAAEAIGAIGEEEGLEMEGCVGEEDDVEVRLLPIP